MEFNQIKLYAQIAIPLGVIHQGHIVWRKPSWRLRFLNRINSDFQPNFIKAVISSSTRPSPASFLAHSFTHDPPSRRMSKACSEGTLCWMVKLLFSHRSRCSHSKRLLFPICTNDQWLQFPIISSPRMAPSTIDLPEADTGQISHRLKKGSLIYIFIPSDPAQVFDFVFISLSKLKAFSSLPLKSPRARWRLIHWKRHKHKEIPNAMEKRGLGKLDRHELFPTPPPNPKAAQAR